MIIDNHMIPNKAIPDGTEDQELLHLQHEVELAIAKYDYIVPDGSIGGRMTDAAIADGLAQMRTSLVNPYWLEVEVRDTFEQVGMSEPPRRRCVVVADDRENFVLLFDPTEGSFVLAEHTATGLTTIGVRGDAVGCFLAR